jgi:hypothetical protein
MVVAAGRGVCPYLAPVHQRVGDVVVHFGEGPETCGPERTKWINSDSVLELHRSSYHIRDGGGVTRVIYS